MIQLLKLITTLRWKKVIEIDRTEIEIVAGSKGGDEMSYVLHIALCSNTFDIFKLGFDFRDSPRFMVNKVRKLEELTDVIPLVYSRIWLTWL